MPNENDRQKSDAAPKKKRKWKEVDGGQKGNGKRRKEIKENEGLNADQLAWKKISLENDEFDDFEEIEGVDVEYVDKDHNKVIQFKVYCKIVLA